MEYKSYQHVEKLGSSQTHGILEGTCYVFYKIDGTNGCIFYKDNQVRFGSRRRELNFKEGQDNQGFEATITTNENYKPMYEDLQKFFEKYPNYIIYGEWLVCGTLKTYKEEAKRQFYIFDVYNPIDDTYINYEEYKKEFDENFPNLKYIPLLAKLDYPTSQDLMGLLDRTGEYLITQGLGEGIVIKNYSYRNGHGNTIWAKMLTEDFKNRKQHTKQENKENKQNSPIEYNISKLLSDEHISKEYNKLLENKQTSWEMKYMLELINRVFNEFINDNIDIILNKFHLPTINFKLLKQLCTNKVRDWVEVRGNGL